MNSQTMLVDTNWDLVSMTFSDVKELFNPQTFATCTIPFLLLADTKLDDAMIISCVDLGLSVSAVQENTDIDDLELYRAFILQNSLPREWGCRGNRCIRSSCWAGKEQQQWLFLHLWQWSYICIEHRRLTKEALDSKQKVDEGSSMSKNQKVGEVFAGGKAVQLLQSDIRQFSRKKILKTKEVRSVAMAMVKELNLTTSCREKKSPKEGYIYIKIQRGQWGFRRNRLLDQNWKSLRNRLRSPLSFRGVLRGDDQLWM